jgi:hypothetical protein
MSDAFYTEMANTALGIITEYQQGVLVLERRTPVAGAQPWEPDVPTIETFPVVGVVQGIDRRLVNGTSVLNTDRMAIIPATSLPVNVQPLVSDRLIIDGIPTTIKQVIRVPEAGILIVFRLVIGS